MKHQENSFEFKSIIQAGVWTTTLNDLNIEHWIKSSYNYQIKHPHSVSKSNTGGWQSEANLHSNLDFYPLVEYINTLQKKITKNPNIKIDSMWVNISPHGAHNVIHTHEPTESKSTQSNLSGVLYLKIPKQSGNIFFYNPLSINDCFSFTPIQNQIIFFHQILPHSVSPNLSQEDRISIAFNFN